ncbi:MAG TPA: peptidoglycan DD-metalloendopeptidase family protein [Candidatus Limnocylindrales bacterium]|nr:peptidoglycan DD-metalloendopeptidase family protein [Candidatus Limnocylindrales bacterium]
MRPSAHTDKNPSRSAESSRTGDQPRPAAATRQGRRRPRGLMRLPLLVLIPLLVGLFGGPTSPAGADELSDARARQTALAQQLKDQKRQVAEINALQADLSSQIDSTRGQLSGINADLSSVKKSITSMGVKINIVRRNYLAQVATLQQLDIQLDRITVEESVMTVNLRERKALLAERLRQAYDTDRTSMLETFLSAGSFTDVLSQVSYTIDVGEQDKQLAEQIVHDQATLGAVHESVIETRQATDDLRVATAAQKVKLDAALKELKVAQKELKRLEAETARALAVQRDAYRKLAANKHNLAKAIAAAGHAKAVLAKRISNLVAAAYAHGNIPSQYNGTLRWPMVGTVSQDFGCTGMTWEPPLGSCPHFHQGIDIVAPYGTAVRASGNGTVVYCGWNYADGADPAWIVIIGHSQSLETWYAHMLPNCPAGAGTAVHAGQVIGHEGNTGHSTGAHLHWAVRFNNDFVNPRLFL